jgi:hypothetical protein
VVAAVAGLKKSVAAALVVGLERSLVVVVVVVVLVVTLVARGTSDAAAAALVLWVAGLGTSTVAAVATAVEWVAVDLRRSVDSVWAAEDIVMREKLCWGGYSSVCDAALEGYSNSRQFLETEVLGIEIAVDRNPIERRVVVAAGASWAVAAEAWAAAAVGAWKVVDHLAWDFVEEKEQPSLAPSAMGQCRPESVGCVDVDSRDQQV